MSKPVAGEAPPRSWPQRLLIAFNVALLVVCTGAAGALAYFYQRFGELPRVSFAQGVLGGADPGEPQNYLLVGSDSRAFADGDTEATASFGDTGDVSTARADTIILVRIDPRGETAAMVSFPRDLWLPIAGTGGRNRINTAFEGGPEQLVRTITQNFDVSVDHFVQVDFRGFKGLVDAVGGVKVFLPAPVRDRDSAGNNVSGLDIDQTGCVELTGDQALSYVRSRHFEQFVEGRWQPDPTGDLGRINRQQDFIRRAANAALSKGLTNPGKLDRVVGVAKDNVQIDASLKVGDVLEVAKRFKSLKPGTLQQLPLPVEQGTTDGGASVLFLDEEKAEDVLAVLRGEERRKPEVAPAAVQVRVLNGTGRAGEAGATAAALADAGFGVAGTGDGARGTARTTILYGSGQRPGAELVASYLQAGAQLEEDSSLQGVDAVVLTGSDFAGVSAEPTQPEPPPSTETTAPPAPPPGPDGAPAPGPPC